jgi:hypothetical protein
MPKAFKASGDANSFWVRCLCGGLEPNEHSSSLWPHQSQNIFYKLSDLLFLARAWSGNVQRLNLIVRDEFAQYLEVTKT